MSLLPATSAQLAMAAPNWTAMKTAIAECERIDEVKALADRALAIRVYYAQSNDTDNELAAMRVRYRAERRLGELIQQEQEAGRLASQENGRPPEASSLTRLTDLGISYDRSARAQKLAAIPSDQFERAMETGRPSLRSLTRRPVDTKQVDRVLKTWGMIRDFAGAISEQKLVEPSEWSSQPGIQPFQVQEIREAIPRIIEYLTQLRGEP